MIVIGGIVVGLLLLITGGAALIHGACQAAARLGWSPLVVGLTIVGFGTSAPELVVSVIAALQGDTELVFGNVVGSNIANLGLILGIAAVIAPIHIHGQLVRREVPFLLIATTIIMVVSYDELFRGEPGAIHIPDALILVVLFGIFFYMLAIDLVRSNDVSALFPDIAGNPIIAARWLDRLWWLFILVGIALLFVGGNITVRNAIALAGNLGVSSNIIGLFTIAIGTSLPELVTSIIAAARKESDLAIGNVVGSNIFNGLFVLPASAFVATVDVPGGGMIDLAVSWVFAALLIPFFYFGHARLGRLSGVIMLGLYGAYAIGRLAA